LKLEEKFLRPNSFPEKTLLVDSSPVRKTEGWIIVGRLREIPLESSKTVA